MRLGKTLIMGGAHATGKLINRILYFVAKYPEV